MNAFAMNYNQEISEEKNQYVMMKVNEQLFGMRVDGIEDILLPQKITPIPLAPDEILGSLNLRGRIVTAVDLKRKLGIPSKPREISDDYRSAVVDYEGELYSIIVDEVSEVLSIGPSEIAHNPENLSEKWKSISDGVYSFKDKLMIILNVHKLLYSEEKEEE